VNDNGLIRAGSRSPWAHRPESKDLRHLMMSRYQTRKQERAESRCSLIYATNGSSAVKENGSHADALGEERTIYLPIP